MINGYFETNGFIGPHGVNGVFQHLRINKTGAGLVSSSAIFGVLMAYFALGTGIALLARRRMVGRTMADFFLANRALGGVVAALTYTATTYSAFMLIGLAGFTYTGGVGALGFELIYLSGLVLVAFFGPRFWLAGQRYQYVTPSELLGDRYQSVPLAVVSALASVIFLIPYSAVQLIGIGKLLEGISGGSIAFSTGVILATIFAVTWAYIGGMRSVAWTDSLQAAVMLVVATVSVFFIVQRGFGGFDGLFSGLEREYPRWLTVPGPGFFNFQAFLGLSLPWFFFCLSNPQVSQRLFVPRSLYQMRIMVMGFLIFGFIYTLISVIWGFSARLLLPDLTHPDMATPTLLSLDIVPTFLALLVMLGITAAAISTVNSIVLTLSSMVARDVLKRFRPGATEEWELLVGRLFIPVFTACIYLFALRDLDLIAALSVASSAGLLVMVPALVGAFFWKAGTAAAALASIVLGGSAAVFLQFSGMRPLGMWPGVWSGIISCLIFIGVSLVTAPPKDKAEEFLGYLKEMLNSKRII